MSALRALAPGKINLSLRVHSPDGTGMHPLESLAQSIDHGDILTISETDEDLLTIFGADLPTDGDNLVWKAVRALRDHSGRQQPVGFELTKRLAVAAGLGGGSSDAAAALILYKDLAGLTDVDLDTVAAGVGADVVFCLHGGLRWMRGYGERLSASLPPADDYHVAVAVPPFPLDTPRVYAAWDRLGEPEGYRVAGRSLPPSLRSHAPLINDLYPAAAACEPLLDDWRAELAAVWDRPVLLSGSGPALFSFFGDESEAEEGVSLVAHEARSAFVAAPIGCGVRRDDL